MNPALSQEFHLFCEQEHPQRHANTDKNPYYVYGTLNCGALKGNHKDVSTIQGTRRIKGQKKALED